MQSKPNLEVLTGLRGVAACLVLLGHTLDTVYSYNGIAYFHSYFSVFTYLGMTMFFVLSGFVITYVYYEPFKAASSAVGWIKEVGSFARARFARLYPLYIFFMCVMVWPVQHLYNKASINIQLSHITLTQSWWNHQSFGFAPAWSISTECFFYMIFAILMMKYSHFPEQKTAHQVARRAIYFCVFFLFFLFLLNFFRNMVVYNLLPIFYQPSQKNIWEWLQYFSPYIRLAEFVIGSYAARYYMLSRANVEPTIRAKRIGLALRWLCLLGILCFMCINILSSHEKNFLFYLSINFGWAPFIAYILYNLCHYKSNLAVILSSPFALRIGEISYSIYLMQFFVYYHTHGLWIFIPREDLNVYNTGYLLSVALAIILGIILVSFLTYNLVEKPSRRILKKKIPR